MGAKHQLKGIYFPKKAGLRRRVESVDRNGVGEDRAKVFPLIFVVGLRKRGGNTKKGDAHAPLYIRQRNRLPFRTLELLDACDKTAFVVEFGGGEIAFALEE